MVSIDAVIARLRRYVAAENIAKSALAQSAGVSESTLRHFHRPDWNPTRETLTRLEAVIPADWSGATLAPGADHADPLPSAPSPAVPKPAVSRETSDLTQT